MKKIFIALLLLCTSLFALKISRDKTDFQFIQLPAKPLPTEVDGYELKVVLNYAKKNEEAKAQYQARLAAQNQQYRDALSRWEADKKQRREVYNAQMKEYNELSAGKKLLANVVTEGSAKPTLVLPPQPVRPMPIEPPLLLKEHNVDVLQTNCGGLDGYSPDGDTKALVEVMLHGFEFNGPDLKEIENTKKRKDGSTYKYYTYRYKTTYRHPLSVKVSYNGTAYGTEMPASTKKYNTITSQTFKSKHAARNWWNSNKNTYLTNLDEQQIDKNLKVINYVLNHTFGYPKVKRKALVRVPSDKRQQYDDYVEAKAFAVAAYTALVDDLERTEAKEKFQKAITIWEQALNEAQPNEKSTKKARVTSEVTAATYLNLIEAAIFSHDYNKADNLLVKMNTLKLKNKDEREAKRLRKFMKEQKARFKAKL